MRVLWTVRVQKPRCALEQDIKSIAGIMAEGESTFVFINTVDFLQVMQGRKHDETKTKTALLQSMPLFEQCSDEQLHNTAMFMFQRKYEKGQIVAKEGDDCVNIYLLESGEVELRQVRALCRLIYHVVVCPCLLTLQRR